MRKIKYLVIFISILLQNFCFAQDSIVPKRIHYKVHYFGIDAGGPGVFGSINYKNRLKQSEKFWLTGVIGLTYADLWSESIGVPLRLESNVRLSNRFYLTNQIAISPWINFFPRPTNDSLRKAYIKNNNHDGLVRRIEYFNSVSCGLTYSAKKYDFQFLVLLLALKNWSQSRAKYYYEFAPFAQISVYYKIFK